MDTTAELTISKKVRTHQELVSNIQCAPEVKNDDIDNLLNEGGEDFYSYVSSKVHSPAKGLIVLSSKHHYYYDSEEMHKVRSIVALKKLNRVGEMKSFLNSHLNFLPDKCNFIGCFINNSKIEQYALREGTTKTEKTRNSDNIELGIVSRFPFLNMIYSLLDSRTNSYMSETSVTQLLGLHGFKVLNMTEINGLTYFHSRKVSLPLTNLN